MILVIFLAIVLAINIGANNSAAEMGIAYGAGVRTLLEAVVLIAVFASLGAITAGQPVIKTLGKGIVPEVLFRENLTNIFLILSVTGVFIILANISKIPVATTHVIVSAIAGIGLYHRQLNLTKLGEIVSFWLVTPMISLVGAYCLNKYLNYPLTSLLARLKSEQKIRKVLAFLVTVSGCYTAYSAGANNAANSVGPIVGAGILGPKLAAGLAGLAMSLGALLFGRRVIHTVGKEITELCIICAILLEFLCGTIILVSSLLGMPVSLSQIITCGVIGVSWSRTGFNHTLKKENVKKMAFFWVIGPFITVAITYVLCVMLHIFHI